MMKRMTPNFYWQVFAFFVVLAGLVFWFWSDEESNIGKTQKIAEKKVEMEFREWPLESLPDLSFDETLTLFGSEVKRYVQQKEKGEPVDWYRIQSVSTRIEELHLQNLEKIAEVSAYYETHSPEVKARFDTFKSEYHRRYSILKDSLAKLKAGDDSAEEKIINLLRESGALSSRRNIPEPEDLPRRQLYSSSREPRMTSQEWEVEPEVANTDTAAKKVCFDDLFSVGMAYAQEGNDLEETMEIKFTPENAPEIQALLDNEGLRGNPVEIANWVRNNIEFIPIWGALQNSVTCLNNGRGTAMDIATLTIALMRGSGIPANYQSGTISIPIDNARNWLGNFEDANAAASLLASGGTAAVVQVDDTGEPVALKFEHVWVRAYVDFIPSMGGIQKSGDSWIDIDTSIRLYDYMSETERESLRSQLEALDSYQALQTFTDDSMSACTEDPVTGEFVCENDPELDQSILLDDEIDTLLLDQFGSYSVAEMLGLGRPRYSNSPVLPAAPEFKILARGWESASLEDSHRFKVNISLTRNGVNVLDFESDVSAIGTSRLSLFFTPASETDRLLLADQLPDDPQEYRPEVFHVAGIKVIPELRIQSGTDDSNTQVYSGSPLDMGAPLLLTVKYQEPVLNTAPINMHIVAGELTAICLDTLSVPPQLFDDIATEVQEVTSKIEAEDPGFDPDQFLESLLSAAVHMWFKEVDVNNTMMASALGAVTHRYPSAGICSAKWISDTVFGLPLNGVNRGVSMDIPGDVVITISRNADTDLMAAVGIQQGFMGSGLEAMVPGQLFHFGEDDPSYFVGTTQALGLARLKGGTLALIDSDNIDDVLPGWHLSAADVEEIRNAVNQGLVVLAHATPLEDEKAQFAGYAILDMQTGSGMFRMSSTPNGTSGGDPMDCIGRYQPPNSVAYNFARAWQDTAKSQEGKYLLDRLKDNSPQVSKAVSVLTDITGTFTTQMGNYNAAYAVLGPSAEPLKGFVMLFTFLDVIKTYLHGPAKDMITYATKVAWQGVINTITYLVRLESMASGINIPTECLDMIQI